MLSRYSWTSRPRVSQDESSPMSPASLPTSGVSSSSLSASLRNSPFTAAETSQGATGFLDQLLQISYQSSNVPSRSDSQSPSDLESNSTASSPSSSSDSDSSESAKSKVDNSVEDKNPDKESNSEQPNSNAQNILAQTIPVEQTPQANTDSEVSSETIETNKSIQADEQNDKSQQESRQVPLQSTTNHSPSEVSLNQVQDSVNTDPSTDTKGADPADSAVNATLTKDTLAEQSIVSENLSDNTNTAESNNTTAAATAATTSTADTVSNSNSAVANTSANSDSTSKQSDQPTTAAPTVNQGAVSETIRPTNAETTATDSATNSQSAEEASKPTVERRRYSRDKNDGRSDSPQNQAKLADNAEQQVLAQSIDLTGLNPDVNPADTASISQSASVDSLTVDTTLAPVASLDSNQTNLLADSSTTATVSTASTDSASSPSTSTLNSTVIATDQSNSSAPRSGTAQGVDTTSGIEPNPTKQLTAAQQGRLLQRVARAFLQSGESGGQVKLRLHPPELGSLQVAVRVDGNKLSATLEAETPAARDALIDGLPQLKKSLAEQGMEVEKFEVTVSTPDNRDAQTGNGQSQSGFQSGNSDQPPQRRQTSTNALATNRTDTENGSAASQVIPRWSRGLNGIDLQA